jgi:hypothetical protein
MLQFVDPIYFQLTIDERFYKENDLTTEFEKETERFMFSHMIRYLNAFEPRAVFYHIEMEEADVPDTCVKLSIRCGSFIEEE